MTMRFGIGLAVAVLATVGTAEAQRPAPAPPAPPAPPSRPASIAPPSPPSPPSPPPAYQGGAAERTERFSRRVRIGRNGRFSISNIAGDLVITAASGDEVSIDAVKRTRGDERELADVTIEVDASNNRVDVRTVYSSVPDRRRERGRFGGDGRFRGNDWVRVDYTIAVPAAVEVDAKSVSGTVKITGVQGAVRAETISGGITTTATPNLEVAKSVSGTVEINDIATDRSVAATTISGALRGRNVKARSLELRTVSGDMALTDAASERIEAQSMSGSIDFTGSLARGGRYDFNVHSGAIRLTLPDSVGFHLDAVTFNGSIRSDLPRISGSDTDRGGGRGRGRGLSVRSIQATFGDGSAMIDVRTFSGAITITKR